MKPRILASSPRATVALTALGAALLIAIGPAAAHHSFAMFDSSQRITISGTVREFQWTNPHIFVELMVSENGTPENWSLEAGSPNQLQREGWSRTVLSPGDKITVLINPRKDGTHGGWLRECTLPDGTVLGK